MTPVWRKPGSHCAWTLAYGYLDSGPPRRLSSHRHPEESVVHDEIAESDRSEGTASIPPTTPFPAPPPRRRPSIPPAAMAATFSPPPAGSAYRNPMSSAAVQPAGTFLPNTKVQVGSHRVIIEKYLSEGGFAHVYVVRVPSSAHPAKYSLAVLKRVAVPDKETLASMRVEVETMKKLKGHRHVVSYMDSHASQLKGGGYEVFLLMEYCTGGGLIDFMNTRLQHRLTEPEILKIFGDVSEGVACMHYLKPPLLHRDLKVENVLITKSPSGTPMYKLCDFGSAAPPRPAAKTADEGRLIEEDVQKHTTMQYRSPEMINVWRRQPIDEKADIWALGVLLYKLCYYTTPFEDVGQMAILNANFKFPAYPAFSGRLKKFISWMLKEDPRQRPNIYQVIVEVCAMRGTEVPIKDIYADRTPSESRRNQSLPTPPDAASSPAAGIGLQQAAPQVAVQQIPEIAPMRRGRPTAPTQTAAAAAAASKPSPSPARGDPFAALDSKNHEVRAGAVDELSKRFPSLDDFSIAADKDKKFPFQPSGSAARQAPAAGPTAAVPMNQRVTDALADQVFGQVKGKADVPKSASAAQLNQQVLSPPAVGVKNREPAPQASLIHQPTPVRTGAKYTSTGTGSSPPRPKPKPMEVSQKPIWRVPDHHRSASQPRASEAAQRAAHTLNPHLKPAQRPAALDMHRSKSQTATLSTLNALRSPGSASSRPSLEGHRPSADELDDTISRTKSAQSRSRPSSVYVSSNLDYLRDQEAARKSRPSMEGSRRHSRQPSANPDAEKAVMDDTPIDSDMDFLRDGENNGDGTKRKSSRPSHERKRSSLPSVQGAKQLFGGRIGDAFKRFEQRHASGDEHEKAPATPPARGEERDMLSPVPGSEATPSRHSTTYDNENGSGLEESIEDLPPDVRRELERRRLSQEEKRVADAAAEYRARVAEQGTGSKPTRASTIQQRVQSLLDEGNRPQEHKRTAEGYGRYTESSGPAPAGGDRDPSPVRKAAPAVAKKPAQVPNPDVSRNPYPRTRQHETPIPTASVPTPSASAPPAPAGETSSSVAQRAISRPSVPPKSQALRTGGSGKWPPPQARAQSPERSSVAPSKPASGGLAALLAKDLEGVPEYPPRGSSTAAPTKDYTMPARSAELFDGDEDKDLEADFSKRYPSLAGIEMVETEIGGGSVAGRQQRVREV